MRFMFLAITACTLLTSTSFCSYPDDLIAITDIDPKVFDMDFSDDKDDEKGESGYHFSRVINLKQNADIAIADPVSPKKIRTQDTYYRRHYRFLTEIWHNQTWYKLSSSEGIRWHSVGGGKTPKTD